MFPMPAEFYLFFGFQLPATILLGLLLGVVAVHVLVVRLGRMSLRAMAGIVLIAALESAVIVQNPLAWAVLLMLLVLMAASMALVDLAILLGFDQILGPRPSFPSWAGQWGLILIPPGLIALSFLAAGYFKFFLAINSTAVSWFGATIGCLGLLIVPALGDLLIRAILAGFAKTGPDDIMRSCRKTQRSPEARTPGED